MKPYKIYACTLEAGVLEQFLSAMEQSCVVKGALMPDAHLGYSLPIGAVIATENMIFPSWIGYDQGCGVATLQTNFKKEQFTEEIKLKIFNQIYRDIPIGMGEDHKQAQNWSYLHLERTPFVDSIIAKGLKQCGTLGAGNHFLEISYDSQDNLWIIVHSGSRGFGHNIATHYMKLASGSDKAKEGHYGFKADSEEGRAFIMDLNFALEFALENRKRMLIAVEDIIARSLGDTSTRITGTFINRNHNHAELKDGLWIHRKGATHAEDGMMGVIPGNMKDGSFIIRGKGNPDSLCSSSHGAGRVMSRTKAKANITLESFTSEMAGVMAKVTSGTLDESPKAYKDIFEVMALQTDLVEVVEHLRPLINIKAEDKGRRR